MSTIATARKERADVYAPDNSPCSSSNAKIERPPGWEESDDEDATFLEEENDQHEAHPQTAHTWLDHVQQTIWAGWQVFDKWAAAIIGLDESKYEWAIIEKELQEQQDLEDLALDNTSYDKKMASMESGIEMGTCHSGSLTAPSVEVLPPQLPLSSKPE